MATPIADVNSESWRQYARSILASYETPLVLFEFQIDLLKDDWFAKSQFEGHIAEHPDHASRYAFMHHRTMRFDAIALNPWTLRKNKGPIKVLEFKSCRRDFAADHKWQRYLPYCTQFGFLAPEGAIDPKELPAGVGLYVPRTVELKHIRDDWHDPPKFKAGEVYDTVVQPQTDKRWKKHDMTEERRKVIFNRLMSRSLAFMLQHQREHERVLLEKHPELLAITHAYNDFSAN